LAGLLAWGVLLLAVFGAGFLAGGGTLPTAAIEVAEVDIVDLPPGRIEALEQELEIALTRSEVDRAALELLRRDIADQKDRMSDLAEGLRFYKSLMAPGAAEQGLSLRRLELVATKGERRYAFRIVVQQEARKHRTLVGSLRAEIYGLLGDQRVSYSLAELTDSLQHPAVALEFRYFQAVEGVLRLPDGFTPQGVQVVATATKPKKMQVIENYRWEVGDRFTYLGN
jgi:hypothetical protein